MSDTNRTQLYDLWETTWGVIPASAMTRLRFTGESIGHNKSSVTSNEIRSDRQIADYIQNGAEASGALNFEMSYGTYDEYLMALLQSVDFAALTLPAAATDISAAVADNSYNSTITDFTAAGGPSAGQWIYVTGFTTAGNNGYAQVVSVTSTKVVVTGLTLADEVAGDAITFAGSTIINGVTARSTIIEKAFTDLTPAQYIAFTGMMANTGQLTINSRSILTGTINLVGKEALAASATTVGTGAASAATTTSVMNSVTNVTGIREGGSAFPGAGTDFIKNLMLNINNNLVGKDGVGYLHNVDIRAGEADFNGSLQAYFESTTLYDKFVQDTVSSVSWRLEDPDNALNAYVFSIPSLKYGEGNPVITGKNDDVLIDAQFQAFMDATLGYTIRIDKFAA